MPDFKNAANPQQAVLILGARTGTKVGRAQFVTTSDPIARILITAFWSSTPDGAYLTPIGTYSRWSSLLRRAWQMAHVEQLGFTAHSPRSGWATELRLKGVSFTEIKTQGRWSSDKSLLTYLDVSTTMLLQLQLGELAGHASWLEGDFSRRFPWSLSLIDARAVSSDLIIHSEAMPGFHTGTLFWFLVESTTWV